MCVSVCVYVCVYERGAAAYGRRRETAMRRGRRDDERQAGGDGAIETATWYGAAAGATAVTATTGGEGDGGDGDDGR